MKTLVQLLGSILLRTGLRLRLGYHPEWVRITCAPPPCKRPPAPPAVPVSFTGHAPPHGWN